MIEDSGALTLINLQTCNHFLLSVMELEKKLKYQQWACTMPSAVTLGGLGQQVEGLSKLVCGQDPQFQHCLLCKSHLVASHIFALVLTLLLFSPITRIQLLFVPIFIFYTPVCYPRTVWSEINFVILVHQHGRIKIYGLNTTLFSSILHRKNVRK